MYEFATTPLFTIFAIALILESLKTLILGTVTAAKRGNNKRFLNKEDADWLGGESQDIDHPDSARIFRAHRNNIENLVPFAILGFLYLMVDGNQYLGIGYFTLFFIGRIGHTYAYLSARAMFRRNMYVLAWFPLVAISVHLLVIILSGLTGLL